MKQYINLNNVMEISDLSKNEATSKLTNSKNLMKIMSLGFIVMLGFNLVAQDVILKKDGSEINAKVLEITDQIKYKDFDFQSGPTRNVNISEVFMITYENGKKEVFNVSTTPTMSSQPRQQQQSRQIATRGYQQTPDSGLSIHLGGAFPVGNFGDDSWEDNAFGAGPGFDFGLKSKIPLPVNGLGFTISGDFIFNGLKGQWKDAEDRYKEEVEEDGGSYTRSRYINVPIFVGLNYKYSINQNIGFFGEFGLGPNLRTQTTEKEKYSDYWEKTKYPIKMSFGFQAGAGIIINDLFSVGLHYYALGAAKVKMKYESSEDNNSDTWESNKKYSQNLFIIRLGFHF